MKEAVKENLYLAVNQDWLEKAEIPADKPATGAFNEVNEEVEKLLMKKMADWEDSQEDLKVPEMNEMVKLYRLAKDFNRRDREGGQPAEKYLEDLDRVEDFEDLQAVIKKFLKAGLPVPYSIGNSADMKDTDHYALYLSVPSLILPDTTYYGSEQGEALLAVYSQQTQALLEAMGQAEAEKIVQEALEVDAIFAPQQKSREELADYTKQYNPRPIEEVQTYSQHLKIADAIHDLISPEVDKVIVDQAEFFEGFDGLILEAGVDRLLSWMKVKLANRVSSYLSEDLRQTGSLYSRSLSGAEEIASQDKHAYYLASGQFDQVLGVYYGKEYFGPEARSDVEHMVAEMVEVYKDRLSKKDWLSDQTIEKAIIKLENLDVLVGYPDDWPEIYSQFQVDPDLSLVDNVMTMNQQAIADNFSKWQTKVDRKEWHMSADTVNAYFSPTQNLICFPAAILQYPFYDKDRSPSANYGGIGAVMAHEISHAFDNNGAKFDEKGNMNNWWTDKDFDVFEEKSQAVIDQWDGLDYAGGQVNGTLTVSENIADLGGLTAALQAAEHEAEVDLEEFFYSWARIWANKSKPEYKELLLAVDVHSPAPLRANVTPRNLEAFHKTFNIQEGDGMYMAPQDRVEIW